MFRNNRNNLSNTPPYRGCYSGNPTKGAKHVTAGSGSELMGEKRYCEWQCRKCGMWAHPDDSNNSCARWPECDGWITNRRPHFGEARTFSSLVPPYEAVMGAVPS